MEGGQQEQLFPPEQLQHLQLLPPALTSSRLTLPWSGLAALVSLQPLLIPGIYLSIYLSFCYICCLIFDGPFGDQPSSITTPNYSY